MKVTVSRIKCLRSGQCTYLHPKLFKEGEDGYPTVLVDELPDDLKEEAEDAADICPSGAIDIEE
ncbi:MAG: ferredoxin [Dehalococcoidia bacterium]